MIRIGTLGGIRYGKRRAQTEARGDNVSTLVLTLVLLSPAASKSLDLAAKALLDFRAEEALALLEPARSAGPYSRKEYIRLFEQLGIAYAYLERSDDALEAFDMVLALDPGRAISYTLSPKVTFLFEQARKKAQDRPTAMLDLGWPLELKVGDPIPIDVEVIADPRGLLKKAKLYHRLKGAPEYQAIDLSLPPVAGHQQITLWPAAPAAKQAEMVDVYLVAYDRAGNEVFEWGTKNRPREIPLRYEPPDPWYTQWYFWAIAGTLVAAGASVAVFAATRSPGPTINGNLMVVPQ